MRKRAAQACHLAFAAAGTVWSVVDHIGRAQDPWCRWRSWRVCREPRRQHNPLLRLGGGPITGCRRALAEAPNLAVIVGIFVGQRLKRAKHKLVPAAFRWL